MKTPVQTPVQKPVETRRDWLQRLTRVLGLTVCAEAATAVAVFLAPRRAAPPAGGFGGVVTAGRVDNFAPGQVTAFAKGRFYLVRLRDGGFLALSRRCTHLGCTVPWDEQSRQFLCPCHASRFDEVGTILSPPAPRPLDLYAVRIEQGVVKVDTSAPILRDRFEPGQVVKP